MTEREGLERDLATEVAAVNEIARDLSDEARLLSCAKDEQTIINHYVKIRVLMDNLTRRYEWSRYAGIQLSVHKTMYR